MFFLFFIKKIPATESICAFLLYFFFALSISSVKFSKKVFFIRRPENFSRLFDCSKAGLSICHVKYFPSACASGISRQDHRGRLWRRGVLIHLLAVLADHVRLRELAQRPGDEALLPALHPPHRGTPRLQRLEIYPVIFFLYKYFILLLPE